MRKYPLHISFPFYYSGYIVLFISIFIKQPPVPLSNKNYSNQTVNNTCEKIKLNNVPCKNLIKNLDSNKQSYFII